MDNIVITNKQTNLIEENTGTNKNYIEYNDLSDKNILYKENRIDIFFEDCLDKKTKECCLENSIFKISSIDNSEIEIKNNTSIKNDENNNENYNVNEISKKLKNSYKKINPKELIKEYIGHISEAHHFILDNEFILKGYRINFHSCKRISRSLCMCHNETINIWTHIIGATLTILFMFMVFLNIGPINTDNFIEKYYEKIILGKTNHNIIISNCTIYNFTDTYSLNTNENNFNSNKYKIGDVIENNNNTIELKINHSKKFRSGKSIKNPILLYKKKDLMFKILKNLTFEKLKAKEIPNKLFDSYSTNIKTEFETMFNDFKYDINHDIFEKFDSYMQVKNFISFQKENIIDDNKLFNFVNNTEFLSKGFNYILLNAINVIIEKYNKIIINHENTLGKEKLDILKKFLEKVKFFLF